MIETRILIPHLVEAQISDGAAISFPSTGPVPQPGPHVVGVLNVAGEPHRTIIDVDLKAAMSGADLRRETTMSPSPEIPVVDLLPVRIPKTPSLAIGACLTRDQRRRDPGCRTNECPHGDCHDPWLLLVACR